MTLWSRTQHKLQTGIRQLQGRCQQQITGPEESVCKAQTGIEDARDIQHGS